MEDAVAERSSRDCRLWRFIFRSIDVARGWDGGAGCVYGDNPGAIARKSRSILEPAHEVAPCRIRGRRGQGRLALGHKEKVRTFEAGVECGRGVVRVAIVFFSAP